jgi:hypothetical protein
MKQKLLALLAALVCWLGAHNALALTYSGTLKYTNNWSTSDVAGGRFASLPGTSTGLSRVEFCMVSVGSGLAFCGDTSDTGAFALTVPADTYRQRIIWDDRVTNKMKLTPDVVGAAPIVDNSSTTMVLSTSQTGVTVNIGSSSAHGWTASAVRRRADHYDAGLEWFRVMGVDYGLSSDSFFTGMGKIAMQHRASVSDAGTFDFHINTQSNPATAVTVWHELGHVLQANMQTQKSGAGNRWQLVAWGAPQCDFVQNGQVISQPQTAATSLIEGWAQFIAEVVAKTPAQLVGSGKQNICFCGNYQAPPLRQLSIAAAIPACGVASTFRNDAAIRDGLIDLVDTNNPVGSDSCYSESVSLPVSQIVGLMRNMTKAGVGNNFGTNDTRTEDTLSFVDFLSFVQQQTLTNVGAIWINSCFQPGKGNPAIAM